MDVSQLSGCVAFGASGVGTLPLPVGTFSVFDALSGAIFIDLFTSSF